MINLNDDPNYSAAPDISPVDFADPASNSSQLEEVAIEMLESIYFDFKLLTSRSAPLLSASLVLSALFILSHDQSIFKAISEK